MHETTNWPVRDVISERELPSCAVLVMSCDAYRDLWRPFFTLFWRYWPDCPFPVYLASNHANFEDPRVKTLPAGDHTWSKILRLSLEQIDADYVVLLLEDFFLDRSVETEAIFGALKTLRELQGVVLRLFPQPGPDIALAEHAGVGRLRLMAPYRVSAQAALWDRKGLMKVIRDEESPWEFEWKGTVRSRSHADEFYATYNAALSYRQVVERGKWFWRAAKFYEKEQIGCDFSARPVMGPAVALKKALNRLRKRTMERLGMVSAQ